MHARITRDIIDPAMVLAAVGSAADGAVLLFLGTVREQNDGRPVSGMRYDSYAEMAEPVLGEILDAAAAQFGTDRIAAVHRVGELAVGDVAVAVAVSAPHRAAAFDAARHIMEEIKVRLPVWKHEHYIDGASRWLDGAVPPESR
ncbi:MAG TPA: molybdenum cofactor biosynthesis protein MoaE [Longimicrobiales bacterium]|nr:molybdenum cofactor biosynthesis protein MoaE [Longimicrobiales bacterium]